MKKENNSQSHVKIQVLILGGLKAGSIKAIIKPCLLSIDKCKFAYVNNMYLYIVHF